MGCRSAMKLNLTQCLEIEANGYRSRCAGFDYETEEVVQRINFLRSKQDERANALFLSHANRDHWAPAVIDETALDLRSQVLTLISLPPTPEEEGIECEELPPLFHGEEFYTNDNGSIVAIPCIILAF